MLFCSARFLARLPQCLLPACLLPLEVVLVALAALALPAVAQQPPVGSEAQATPDATDAAAATSDAEQPAADVPQPEVTPPEVTSPETTAPETTAPSDPLTVDQAADEPAGPPELRFAFREQKWIDVLDWFARQADLSLVVNEVPPGSFTYSDTKPYSPTEALDLLNGVLNTRGFALVRRDRMLICANLNQGIPDGLIPRVQLDDLDEYGQFELVEVMFPLGKRPTDAVANEVRPLLGKYGQATVLPQTKQLLVTTTAGQMRAVNAIISSIPEPQPRREEKKPDPPAPELVVYPAENLDPKAATDMIKSLVGDVKMTVDSRTGQINAYATPKQHEVIQKLLKQMASTSTEELQPRLELYPIDESDASSLLRQLNLIVSDATLTLDANGQLIAYATPKQHEQIRQTLEKLGSEATDPARDIPVVYSLRSADPQTVVTMVEKLFPRAKVTVEPESGRLVLLASTAQQTAIRQFIEQLETQPANQAQIEYYPLGELDPGQTQSVLSSLVPGLRVTHDRAADRLMIIASPVDQRRASQVLQQLAEAQRPPTEKRLARYDVTGSLRTQFERNFRELEPELRDVKLLDSGSPQQLLILATDAEHAMVEAVLSQLEEQFPEQPQRLKYYELDQAVRDKFKSLHGQLAPELGRIQIVDDGAAEGLGVLATEEQHRQIAWVVEQIKAELPATNQRLRVFAVTPTQRERFLALRPSLDQQLASVRIIEPARPGELVAWGTDDQLALIESTLASLRSAANQQPLQLVSYPLSEGDPVSVQNMLTELYPDMKIVVDAESRRVMVWTTAEQHTIVAQAIEQLDAPAASGKSRMAYYRLGDIDARDVARLFEQQFPKMSMVTDRDSNSIIAWGTDRDHEALAKTVEEFRKKAAETERKVVSYPIGRRSSWRMRRLLDELAPAARIVEDEENRAVIVWGSDDEHQAIEQAMQQMSAVGDDANSATLRTYTVTRVRPQDVLRLLDEIAPTAEGTALDDDRRILVFATAQDHERIAAAVERIESGDDADAEQSTVQVYPLGQTTPDVVMPLLDAQLLRSATVTSDEQRNALVVRASAEKHAEMKKAIEAILQDLPEVRTRQSRVYRLEHANPNSLQNALSGLIPGVTIAVDTETQSLIASAYPEEHERIAATVTQLDQPQTNRRETRAYRLGSRDFYGLRSALQELAPNAVVASDRSSRMLLVTADKADQERIAAAIEQLASGGDDDQITRVYRMLSGDPEAAEDALEALLPSAVVRGDERAGTVLITASEDDHVRAKQVIDQLEATPQSTLEARAFRMKYGDVGAARDAIRSLMPRATVEADRTNRSLLVTARESDLQRVAELIAEMDQSNTAGQQTQVYRMKYADVRAARRALQELLPQATIADDDDNRALIVTGSEEDQQRVQEAVAKLDVPRDDPTETRAYSMQYGDAAATQTALRALLPDAVIAADPANRSLIATATPEQHERIKTAVEQMDIPNSQQPVLQAYNVTNADLPAVVNSLTAMYQGNPQVTFTSDQANQSILVKAPPREQQTVAQIVSRMENGAALGEDRSLIVYPVKTQDDATLLATLQNLFKNQQPPVDLSLNVETQQLIAIASPRQHATLRQAVTQIQSEPFVVEVFPLQTVDPFAIELAIDRLYEDASSRPVANGDTETQQLFVRGTKDQIDDVRQLLVKMGELPAQQTAQQRGIRVIPYRGDAQSALDQLRDVWPQLRPNPIQVIRAQTSTPILQSVTPTIEMFGTDGDATPDAAAPTASPARPSAPSNTPSPPNTPNTPSTPADARPAELPQDSPSSKAPGGDAEGNAAQAAPEQAQRKPREAAVTMLVQAAEPKGERAEDAGATSGEPARANEASIEPQSRGALPLVIVPEQNSITIMSDDEAALNQAEALLRTLARQSSSDASAGNFAMYSLRNAGASNLVKMLTELFEQMPITTRATVGRVSMVADERLNAVIVHGRPADRAVIGELLRVLDSSNVPDSLANARPRIVQVEYLEAERVLELLEGVYETQLKTGGDSRAEMDIPDGISREVASLLRQINAAAAGPLLTLEVDSVTNSIVVLAPNQLSAEVEALIQQLDQNARENDSRDIGIVTLKGTNVQQIEDALEQLLRPNRRRR